MKVCVITPIYAIAGVPLAQVRFARALHGIGCDVELMIGRIESGLQLPDMPGITVRVLNVPHVRAMLFPLWNYFRNAKPDVIFSAEDHLNAIVLLAAIASGSKAKVSGSSRVTPFDTYSGKPLSKGWILKRLMRAVMWRADALSCVSKDMVEQYRIVFKSPPHVDIYNIIDDKYSRQKMLENIDHKWFTHKELPVLVAAGKLAPWKGFTDLISAIKILAEKRSVRLIILGDGPLRSELERLVGKLEMNHAIQLIGYVSNPLKYYAHADGFVLSSHVEGLPNVLVEAMMCGCTPVSTDCPTGPREVLQDGTYGYLVPVAEPEAMAHGIELALDKPIPREMLAQAVAPFRERTVLKRHFDALGLSNRLPVMKKL